MSVWNLPNKNGWMANFLSIVQPNVVFIAKCKQIPRSYLMYIPAIIFCLDVFRGLGWCMTSYFLSCSLYIRTSMYDISYPLNYLIEVNCGICVEFQNGVYWTNNIEKRIITQIIFIQIVGWIDHFTGRFSLGNTLQILSI